MASRKHPGKVFVDLDSVKDHLDDYVIFDVCYSLQVPNYIEKAYPLGHMPGAVPTNVDTDLSGPRVGGARHPLPEGSVFAKWCVERGVDGSKPVLCYDEECGAMGGCRMWWMLDDLGVEAYVLNGGIQAYKASGLPVETGDAKAHAPGAQWPFREQFTHHVTINNLSANAIMTDARAAARYDSAIRPLASGDPQPGHIEGAVSLPYSTHLEMRDGVQVLKNEDELRANLEKRMKHAVGSHHDKMDLSNCIYSCGSGVSACINIAVTRHVGLGHPALYCGSWSEYATVYEVPIQRALMARNGLYIKMLSPCVCTNEKANFKTHLVLIDGKPVEHAPSDELDKAVSHLHVGEKAMVCLKNGDKPIVEVSAKA